MITLLLTTVGSSHSLRVSLRGKQIQAYSDTSASNSSKKLSLRITYCANNRPLLAIWLTGVCYLTWRTHPGTSPNSSTKVTIPPSEETPTIYNCYLLPLHSNLTHQVASERHGPPYGHQPIKASSFYSPQLLSPTSGTYGNYSPPNTTGGTG